MNIRLYDLPASRFILRSASLIVPGALRAEWLKEWDAELWQVCHACNDRSSVNENATAFCLGAFQDALWIRRNRPRPAFERVPEAVLRPGSAMRCGSLLATWAAISLLACLSFTGSRRVLMPSTYEDDTNLVILSRTGYAGIQAPAIRLSEYRSWEKNTHRSFARLAFYQPIFAQVEIQHHRTEMLSIARASGNLFGLLNPSLSTVRKVSANHPYQAKLILSHKAWETFFRGDPDILGRIFEIAGQPVLVAGVISEDSWKMPGQMDAWMLEDEATMAALPSGSTGFVLGRVNCSRFPVDSGGHRTMTLIGEAGGAEKMDCISLAQVSQLPFSISLFAFLLACMALPATTPLPLGEYPVRHDCPSCAARARRWIFLGMKFALILPIVSFCSLTLAYNLSPLASSTSIYVQCISSFLGFIFAFRWALRDQRTRCPVCLRMLSNPARVGQASHNFLAWNGTEWICAEGHGLLHIPELPTSWCSSQRWLHLDPSWRGLFSDSWISTSRAM